MRERRSDSDPEQVLERLRSYHQADRPDSLRREQLLKRLRRSDSATGSDRARSYPALSSPEVAAVDPPPARLGRRAVVTLAMTAAAGAGLVLWSFWSFESERGGGSSDGGAPEPAAAKQESGLRACRGATGTQGLLWDASRSTPNLPNLEGRRGRWLYHWATETGSERVDASVITLPGEGGAPTFALRGAGERAVGWGAKLSTGFSVHVGADPHEVRFDCYDASAYAGVRFRARGDGIVFVLLQTEDSIPVELGGTCKNKCWFTASHALVLEDEFRDYRLRWDRFSMANTARPPQARLMLLEFLLQPSHDPYEVVIAEAALMTHTEAAPR